MLRRKSKKQNLIITEEAMKKLSMYDIVTALAQHKKSGEDVTSIKNSDGINFFVATDKVSNTITVLLDVQV